MKETRRKGIIINAIAAVILVLIVTVNAVHAAVITQTISLSANYGEAARSATRTGEYSYVRVKCTAVYPDEDGITDNYTKIRVRVRFVDRTPLTDVKVIEESKGYYCIHIYEGHLTKKNIQFIFTGNSEVSARADVSYDPM